MQDNFIPVAQDPVVVSIIESSLFRCEHAGTPHYADGFPTVSLADKESSRRHISGHTLLIRESSAEYYKQLTAALYVHNACLFYVAPNFDVYGREGNYELRQELKSISLRTGANMSEERIGTNAAALCARYPSSIWTIGAQNYSTALHPYALFAFPVHGRYNRLVYVLLVARCSELTPETISLFNLVEATESIVSGGLLTEDMLIKDAMLRQNYSEEKTENMLILVGSSGQITYANDVFYTLFKTDYREIINAPLDVAIPELSYVFKGLNEGGRIPLTKHVQFVKTGDVDYIVTCTATNQQGSLSGVAITAQREHLTSSEHRLSPGLGAKYSFDDLLGVSPKFIQLKRFAERIADTSCTVLIRGESGTGKELFAHSIHSTSSRRDKPLVSVNCAAIPRELIGSELFGYVGGAFTGASRTGAKGKFELADGGTLFLDEIAEMPVDMQSVLLRVLEDGSVTRIGGSRPTPIDVRLIVATNQSLEEYVRLGKFRLDLYYRLNIIALNMIPLRERREDIQATTDTFISRFSEIHNKQVRGITVEARRAITAYDWPGNVRELRNAIERGVVTCDGEFLELCHLPTEISEGAGFGTKKGAAPPQDIIASHFKVYRRDTVEQLMKEYGGNKSRVAKQMGIARTTLYRILAEIDRAGTE